MEASIHMPRLQCQPRIFFCSLDDQGRERRIGTTLADYVRELRPRRGRSRPATARVFVSPVAPDLRNEPPRSDPFAAFAFATVFLKSPRMLRPLRSTHQHLRPHHWCAQWDLLHFHLPFLQRDPEGDSVDKARWAALSFPLRRMALQFRLMPLRFRPMAVLNMMVVFM